MNSVPTYEYAVVSFAAKQLEVTPHQVRELVHNGDLDAWQTSNGQYLVDALSVAKYRQMREGKGRPLDPQTAFAALWVLSGLNAPWLDYHQMRRLRLRLATISAKDLVWQARRRSAARTFRVETSALEALSAELVFTDGGDKAFSLVSNANLVDGYATLNQIDELSSRYSLIPDPYGNAIVHVASWLPETTESKVPIALRAADLAESLDAREHSAGIGKLEELLDAYSCA